MHVDARRIEVGQPGDDLHQPAAHLLGAERLASRCARRCTDLVEFSADMWPAELDLMAEIAGLRLDARWDGWTREPFTSDSRGHVSVWQKPGG
ncbi:hypothetical protein [Nocardia sp. NPDC004750]